MKVYGLSRSLKSRGIAIWLVLGMVCLFDAASAEDWPTSGGEPGRIIEVTTLANSGQGSLRAALESAGRRKIIFKVAGEIWLQDTLSIFQPFVTVAGETAPSPGISLMGDRVRIRTHDVILRHLRVRVGARSSGTPPENRDGIVIAGSADGTDPGYNILIENCSVSWSIDELVSTSGKNSHDIAVRRSILAEALRNSIHPKGSHSMGLLVGHENRNVLIQGNLFAHNHDRNPVIDGGAEALVVNNLIYNPGHTGVVFYPNSSGPTQASVVGNYVIAGPDTQTKPLLAFSQGLNEGSKIWYADNISEGVVAFDVTERDKDSSAPNPFVSEPPLWPLAVVEIIPKENVPERVLAEAGARPWDRDEVDARIVAEVRARSGQIRDVPTDVRLWP